MPVRCSFLSVASPIVFATASAITFNTSTNLGQYVGAAVAVPCPEARSGQGSAPLPATFRSFLQNKPGCSAGNPSMAAGEERWEGMVTRSNPDKSTLTVRKVGSSVEKTVAYDSSTKWVSQEHGSKKVNDIDASQVKDGERVIVVGKYDDKGVLHAKLISKRLSH
jgi:hypothetical protein